MAVGLRCRRDLYDRNPAAHQLPQICAFFSPEPIPRYFFTGIRNVSIAPELDQALRDPMVLARAIRDINRYSLAKINHRNGTIQLHRLVQLVLRNRMAPQQLETMKHGAHVLLANLDPNDPTSQKHWSRCQDLRPHAYASDITDCDAGPSICAMVAISGRRGVGRAGCGDVSRADR
ncbi:hypothetical protein [Kibdelosporangium aridum]|uniref:DUF7779 domain-containing protein n=1 Tax=Kibdelosporangium aridum TaxID=2030 RepID=UPI000A92AC63|nr:hypothetical protein [Kibdelosporangium aridum]